MTAEAMRERPMMQRMEMRDRERARTGVRGVRTGCVMPVPGAVGAGTSAMSAEARGQSPTLPAARLWLRTLARPQERDPRRLRE